MALYLLSFGISGCHVKKNIEVKVLAHVLSLNIAQYAVSGVNV
jgi:hypothetical protein